MIRMRYLLLVLVGIAVGSMESLFASKEISGDAIIARVNGTSITYGELMVNRETIERAFKRDHGRKPQSVSDIEAIKEEKIEREKRKLLTAIKVAIQMQQAEKLGISVSNEDVDNFRRDYMRTHNIDERDLLRKGRRELSNIIRAYEEVINQGRDPDAVYKRQLANIMSREEWDMRLKYEGTRQRIDQLKALLELSDDEIQENDVGLREMLIQNKLGERIDEQLANEDPEYAKFIQSRAGSSTKTDLNRYGPSYRAARHEQWWQQRYREAEVVIEVEQFRDTWSMMSNISQSN